jgi:hypothetical protein
MLQLPSQERENSLDTPRTSIDEVTVETESIRNRRRAAIVKDTSLKIKILTV